MRLTAILIGLLLTGSASADAQRIPRWVNAGGALTEWIVALGSEPRLGLDTTNQHPQSLAKLISGKAASFL